MSVMSFKKKKIHSTFSQFSLPCSPSFALSFLLLRFYLGSFSIFFLLSLYPSLYLLVKKKQRHASGVCLMRFLTLSFAYGDPMWDTAPLQSHYNTNKVRETELAHGRQQMKLLADRLEQQSNPTHPKSGSQRLPRVVSMNDETDDDDDNTTRRYVKSFRRILREHTDNDINYRTDEDGDPDFPPPAKAFSTRGYH